MINVDELHRFILFIANKQQSGSNPTPNRLNLAVKRAQIAWVNERYNNPKKYQAGKPQFGWQATQRITDDLSFLLVKKDVDVSESGLFDYPEDYMHSSSVRYKFKKRVAGCKDIITKETDVTEIMDSEIGNILSSSIVPPTKRYPYCCYYSENVQFYPKDLGKITFTYLREPTEPKWAYTLTNGRPVYDPANSVDLEAPESALNDIAMVALSYLGVHIREQELIQYSELQQQKGN
jgi:hypothetical protein